MAEVKKYIDSDVYTEAKKRIRHVIDTFDNILVAFSGGKDSLTCVHLVKEVYEELGIKEKVKVFFRDEELIPDNVVNFVRSMAESGEYDFRYYAIPLQSQKFILGETIEYVQWDRNRKWLRQPPEYAITIPDDEYRVFSQYDADEYICRGEKGKVAIITGIRADESLTRLRACINKKNENYINAVATGKGAIKLVKPIYDWTEQDVFIYFCKNDIKYCEIYDEQMYNRERLRVSTPLHAESAKQFSKIKTRSPVFYQQLVDMFPEMLVQEKYWSELDRYAIMWKYDHSFDGIRKYINTEISDRKERALALKRVATAEQIRNNKIRENGELNDDGTKYLGGYPILYVFRQVINGNYKRVMMPKSIPTSVELDYEVGHAFQ